jgi:DNA-binding NtrC family response regulator
MMSIVLIVDDKDLMRDSVGATLQRAGFTVVTAPDGTSALEAISRRRPDCVVTDLKMPGMTGLELIEKVRAIDDDLPIVMMTAFGAVDTAVQAIKAGAFDYITKPFEGDELIVSVKRAIEHARVVRENAVLRSAIDGVPAEGSAPARRGLDRIIGDSPAMRRVKEQVRAVAESQGTVLICGESGTGKEVIAKAVHELSTRSSEAFLAVNCAALSESLLESELFGHEKGAFTGAERTRKGRFELADRGTLLLDEISEISTRVQAKLLRVLQERNFERVGSSSPIGIDVRVVATSNRDLPKAAAAGEFRQDLFFRLNVLPIHLPPLRDRAEDVPLLAESFLSATASREGRPAKKFSEEAIRTLCAYHWPGNVRELQNVCERAAVLAKGEVIEKSLIEGWLLAPEGVSASIASRAPVGFNAAPAVAAVGMAEPKPFAMDRVATRGVTEGRSLEEIEREAIVLTLHRFQGHRQRTATALGIGVRTLGLKLKKWKEQKLVEETL